MSTPRERLAHYIEQGSTGDRRADWKLEVLWPKHQEDTDKEEVLQAIANFVRDGIMEGMSPIWKVTVNPSINLDEEPE